MKIICIKERLQYAVQTVQKAIATKTPMPILTGVYLSAENNRLELQATDYEIGIRCTIDAQVDEPGKIVLSGRVFQEMVRKLPGETIAIESSREDRTIKITSASTQFNLLSLPAEEFPILKPLHQEHQLILKDNVFRDLIKKTVFACATEDSRPIFTGCLLEVNNENVNMVATNTHRLALKSDQVEQYEGTLSVIIPAKILHELGRLLVSEMPMDVIITCQKNQIAFAFDNVYIVSRLLEGQFPDYHRVIPQDFATIVELKTQEFLAAVERVSLITRDGEYNVIKFRFKDNDIMVSSNNPELGKASEKLGASVKGNELEISFNAKYISDILKNMDSEWITFSLNTPLSPACIKPCDDANYTYIITPVRSN